MQHIAPDGKVHNFEALFPKEETFLLHPALSLHSALLEGLKGDRPSRSQRYTVIELVDGMLLFGSLPLRDPAPAK
jgi:hypothetical protein